MIRDEKHTIISTKEKKEPLLVYDEKDSNHYKKADKERVLEFKAHNNNEINVQFFSEIFNLDNIRSNKSLSMYNQIGGSENLLKILEVNSNTGLIINSESDYRKRVDKFGKNELIVKQPKELIELIFECLEDPMLRILLLAAAVSLIIGIAQQGLAHGWIEGFSIFLAVFIVVSISAFNNYSKEKQFAKLNRENEVKRLNVKRGSKKVEINSEDLLVGDILYLEIGNVICADLILLQGTVEVDEGSLTGESVKIKKNITSTPFLISGSMITDGECEALVVAVGVNSYIGKSKLQMQDSNDITPLQEKLKLLADQISNFGFSFGALIFIVIIGREVVFRLFYTHESIFNATMLDTLVNAFILCVTVIVVAIPEGLPMAVTISLAYSVLKMKQEQNLVRHLDASETMSNVNNICTDKTGTLTEGNMSVRSLFFEGNERLNKYPSNSSSSINSPIKRSRDILSNKEESLRLLYDSIIYNISAFVGNNNDIKGNSTECALLKFLMDQNVDVNNLKNNQYELKHRIPFKSENKLMGSIYLNITNSVYDIYIKGAPEILYEICDKCLWNEQIVELTQDKLEKFNKKQNDYSNNAQRTLCLAYGMIKEEIYLKFLNENPDDIFKSITNSKILTLIALVGIADPPRPDVKTAIKDCKSAGVAVRMVTGDNINTALAIAKEVGILDEYEYNLSKDRINDKNILDNDSLNIYALEGSQFREACGGYRIEISEDDLKNKKYYLKDIAKFERITTNLKVIARCSPDDKFLLVLGLKELRNIVAVTGDGTNDAPALIKSDVGFAMGKKGTDIAKEASDIILLNDSFSSVVTAIKYGRNVYDCIRKFIQFQLTTNIVAVFMTLVGGIFLKDAPLNAIQMLWVNLIMDSFASLALATETPSDKLLKRKPYPRDEHMVTQSMIRNIFTQAIFQILLLTLILFYGERIFNVPDDRSLSHFEWNELNGYHYTLFFNIFVFLQVFNSVNARKLEQYELNVVEGILSNNIYISVQLFIIIGQIIIVQFGGRALRTQALSINQHISCIIIAFLTIPYGYIMKILPIGQVNIPNEEEIVDKLARLNSIRDKLPSRGISFKSTGSKIISGLKSNKK